MNYTPSKFHPSDPAYDPPPEPEYFLVGKPRGRCVYCNGRIRPPTNNWGTKTYHTSPWPSDCEWDEWLTEDENRIRYAAEQLEDLQNDRS